MDRSIVAWPSASSAAWYIQQRRTNRTFEAEISLPYRPANLTAEHLYNKEIKKFLDSEYPELAEAGEEPWWKVSDVELNHLIGTTSPGAGLTPIRGWSCLADCDFGWAVARELKLNAYPSTALKAMAEPESVVCITATIRPDLLESLSKISARRILPVFELRSQLFIGPVLNIAHCPCRVCLYARLAAHDVTLDAFISRCLAAQSCSILFSARDIVQGISEAAARPAVVAAASAVRWAVAPGTADSNVAMTRFDLAVGRCTTQDFNPIPGAHNDHWIKPQFMQAITEDPDAIRSFS